MGGWDVTGGGAARTEGRLAGREVSGWDGRCCWGGEVETSGGWIAAGGSGPLSCCGNGLGSDLGE